jgi:type I restriction enzyme S subunit
MLSRTASVGFAAIMGVEVATTQDFANWVCGDRVLPEFLLRVFHAMSGEFVRLRYGSTHNTIYMPDIQAMRMALPSIVEQRAIVAYLDEEAARLDELVAEAERAVALLQERRAALISAAVTGQIDVREVHAGEAA